MNTRSIGEEFWIPTDVEDVKEMEKGLIIDPKDPIVYRASGVEIIIELCLQLGCPVGGVKIGKVAFPACTTPRILEQE